MRGPEDEEDDGDPETEWFEDEEDRPPDVDEDDLDVKGWA